MTNDLEVIDKSKTEFVTEYLEEVDDDWRKEQIRRNLKIKEACSRLHPRKVGLKRSSFLFHKRRKLFYCLNAKVRYSIKFEAKMFEKVLI